MNHRDDEFDRLLHAHRTLTPDEHAQFTRHVMARARAYRAEAIKGLFRWFVDWTMRRAAVARLEALDDRMLKDIGVHRSEIERAVQRGEPPEHRKAA